MRIFFVFQLLALFLVALLPLSAHAKSFWEYGEYIWGPPDRDFTRPYLEEAKLPHNSRWAEDEWSPQDWIDGGGGNAFTVVDGFYDAEIVTDQYFEKKVPVLQVGHAFLNLSAGDQHRVVAFMDDTFQVTANNPAGVIRICLKNGRKDIGLFTKDGLQIQ